MNGRLVPSMSVVALLALPAAACGGGEPEAEAPPAGGTGIPTVEAPAPPPAPPPTEAPAPGTAPVAANLPPGVTAEMVQQGQQIFTGQGICYTCHGQDATGTALAPNLTDNQWINLPTGDYEEIVTLVNTGVLRPKEHPAPMPARGGGTLSEEQVRAVSAYVYSISHRG